MTDHLPECPLLEPCDDEVAEHGYCSMQHGVFCIHCQRWCVCDRLRACEQRVRDKHSQPDAYRGWVKGYAAGLDAARKAVRAIPMDDMCCMCPTDKALTAAIDALREKP